MIPAVGGHQRASDAKLGPPGLRAFATAYIAAAALPSLEGSAFEDASAAALATVRRSWAELRGKRAARALVGEILQQRFLRTGDLQLAERANVHDLVALDQVKKNARYRAMLLGNLGMLH